MAKIYTKLQEKFQNRSDRIRMEDLKTILSNSEIKKINKDEEFRLLPPLIKAYIRAGAWIGKGAVVDKKFNTTDVLIILKSENIIKKYSNLSFK